MPQFLASFITVLIILHIILGAVMYCILLERKIASWVQDRIGPNRVGPYGLLQPFADGIKLMFKEDYTPPGVDRPLFLLAPVLVVVPALIAWAVIPWGGDLVWGDQILHVAGAPIDIGVVFILAIGSVAVYGVVVGGYASNNKYSFLGGLRATAQMLSYEIPLSLCVLMVILSTGQTRADAIAASQSNHVWNILYMPLVAIIFFTCNLAETNRAPFDLAEAEQELVGGYHTEYTSMKLGLMLMGEYIHIITGGAFFATLFLGGWDVPFLNEPAAGGLGWVALKFLSYFAKVFLYIVVVMMVRWTLPRFRFDQLMKLAWRSLIPMTLALLLCYGALQFALVERSITPQAAQWLTLIANIAVFFGSLVVGPFIPQGPPVNRRVRLAGSRFNPEIPAES